MGGNLVGILVSTMWFFRRADESLVVDVAAPRGGLHARVADRWGCRVSSRDAILGRSDQK